MTIGSRKESWTQLAPAQSKLRNALDLLHDEFAQAPVLGSLLNPERGIAAQLVDMNELAAVLASNLGTQDEALEKREIAVVAQGLATAAKLLTGQYHMVATNVPYLARGKQSGTLRDFCEQRYPAAKNDLATVFLARCLELCTQGGTASIVLPQNWLFLSSYAKFREKLLKQETWHLIARLGPGAFETISGEVVKAILISLSRGNSAGQSGPLFGASEARHLLRGLDVSEPRTAKEKAEGLLTAEIKSVEQAKQLENPDARVTLEEEANLPLLNLFADGLVGLQTSDDHMFIVASWELGSRDANIWEFMQSTPDIFTEYAGQSWVVRWEKGKGLLLALPTAYPTKGLKALGKAGIAIHRMRVLFPYQYAKERFHQNVATIIPHNTFQVSRGESEWKAFVAVCNSQLAFNPQSEGVLSGCTNLANQKGPWRAAWERYCEVPGRYPNIPEQIRKCSPPNSTLLWHMNDGEFSGWPQWNDDQEKSLRQDLAGLGNVPVHRARAKVLELEKQHGHRRASVWAELGDAPLACALEYLAIIAEKTQSGLAAGSVDDLANGYQSYGWRVDDAVIRALAQVGASADFAATTIAIRAMYLSWIEESARHLQKQIDGASYPGGTCLTAKPMQHAPGDCILFVDGLRYDMGKRLAESLVDFRLEIVEEATWAALPSVTATGKAAVTPVRDKIRGEDTSPDFEPSVIDTGQSLKGGYHLKKLLAGSGWSILERSADGDGHGMAWCEFGDIDHEGHDRGWKLAKHVDTLILEIRERVTELLHAGWKRIRIVTDHGWLLLPGGLPKIDLPSALADNKWGRCASLKAGVFADERLYPWYWNANVSFALADGVSCFRKGAEEPPGLYRIEINEGPGTGVKILNKPVPPAFRESMGYAEQNLYSRATQLVGDKDPRHHEFTAQLRAFDAAKSGAKVGVAALVALCTALLKKSVRGGLIIMGEVNLGGSIDPVYNPVTIAEIAVEKGASMLLMPVACRRQLFDLSDDMATKIDIQFYSDAKDALLKAIMA